MVYSSSLTPGVYQIGRVYKLLNETKECIQSAMQEQEKELEARDKKIYEQEMLLVHKDQTIHTLERRLDMQKSELIAQRERESFSSKELLSSGQFLEQRLISLQTRNDELQAELTRKDQEIVQLRREKEKADHIIKTLLQKYQQVAKISQTGSHPLHNNIFDARSGISL